MARAISRKNGRPTVVKMEDGRLVEFVDGLRVKMEAYLQAGELVVRFSFVSGEVVTYTLPPMLYQKFALYGALKTLSESARDKRSLKGKVAAVRFSASRLMDEESWSEVHQASDVDRIAQTTWPSKRDPLN